jgi:hypothetical protein
VSETDGQASTASGGLVYASDSNTYTVALYSLLHRSANSCMATSCRHDRGLRRQPAQSLCCAADSDQHALTHFVSAIHNMTIMTVTRMSCSEGAIAARCRARILRCNPGSHVPCQNSAEAGGPSMLGAAAQYAAGFLGVQLSRRGMFSHAACDMR